jgi:hypothetical protein
MPLAAIESYLRQLPRRQAEWCLYLSDVVCLPHMSDRARRNIIDNWLEQLGDHPPVPADPATLALIGIGVKRVRSG